MVDCKIVDTASSLLKMFKASDKQLSRTFQNGLKKVMRQVRKDAVTSLKSKVKNTTRKNPKFEDTLASGVRMTRTWENQQPGKEGVAGRVTIASNRKKGSGSYRLQILEVGSYKKGGRWRRHYKGKKFKTASDKAEARMRKKRKTSEKGYTGRLKAYAFFQPIVINKSKYQQALSVEIEAAVNQKFGHG